MATKRNGLLSRLFQKSSRKKNLKRDIKKYCAILEEYPNDLRTRLRLADAYIHQRELDKAIQEYLQVGEYHIQEDLDQKAVSIFKKILVLDPHMIQARHRLADLYLKRDLFGDAKIQYEKVLEIDPGDTKAQHELRKIRRKVSKIEANGQKAPRGKVSEKDPVWNAVLQELQRQLSSQIDHDDYQSHYHLGVAFKEMGLFDKATEEFKIALKASPLRYDSYLMMGLCYRETERYDQAIECFQKGLALDNLTKRQYEQLYYESGVTFEEWGQLEDALEALSKARKFMEGSPPPEFRSKVKKLRDQLRKE